MNAGQTVAATNDMAHGEHAGHAGYQEDHHEQHHEHPPTAYSNTYTAPPPSSHYRFASMPQNVERRNEIQHLLTIRQQPKHSRMCGYGEKVDRRPIDPPPIIQLHVHDPGEMDPTAFLVNPYYFAFASLVSPNNDQELHLLKDGKTRTTLGSAVSSLFRLKDVDQRGDGGFFVFPDLSVRMEGVYRLKFSLFEVVGDRTLHCGSIISDQFTVYPAKKFPGMEESTLLSRSFAEQGLKIRIRKELRTVRRQQSAGPPQSASASPPPDENAVGSEQPVITRAPPAAMTFHGRPAPNGDGLMQQNGHLANAPYMPHAHYADSSNRGLRPSHQHELSQQRFHHPQQLLAHQHTSQHQVYQQHTPSFDHRPAAASAAQSYHQQMQQHHAQMQRQSQMASRGIAGEPATTLAPQHQQRQGH